MESLSLLSSSSIKLEPVFGVGPNNSIKLEPIFGVGPDNSIKLEPIFGVEPDSTIKLEQVSPTDCVHSSGEEILPEIAVFDDINSEIPASVTIKQSQGSPTTSESYPAISIPEHLQVEMCPNVEHVEQELPVILCEDTNQRLKCSVVVKDKTQPMAECSNTEPEFTENGYKASNNYENCCQISENTVSIINVSEALTDENSLAMNEDTSVQLTPTSVNSLDSTVVDVNSCPQIHESGTQYIADVSGPDVSMNRDKRAHTTLRPFKCDKCSATFTRACSMYRHMKTHVGEKPYKCDECSASFTRSDSLKLHRRKHTGEKSFKTKYGYTVSSNQENVGQMSENMVSLINMSETLTNESSQVINIDTTVQLSSLNSPDNTVGDANSCPQIHESGTPYIPDVSGPDVSMNRDKRAHTTLRPFKCDKCSATFTRARSMNRHMKTHAGEKPYKCDECGASFTRSDNLKLHRRKHTGEKSFKAKNGCNESESQENVGQMSENMVSLINMSETLTNESSQVINIDTTVQLSSLNSPDNTVGDVNCCPQIHESGTQYIADVSGPDVSMNRDKRAHTTLRPFKCDKCSATFTRARNMYRHMKTHAGEKPYKCDECSASFTRSDNLKLHRRKHTGEKSFKTKYGYTVSSNQENVGQMSENMVSLINISETLTNESSEVINADTTIQLTSLNSPDNTVVDVNSCLQIHERGTPYIADVSGPDVSMNRDKRAHTTLRPFKCDKCSATFTRARSMYRHMKTHAGEKPYKCDECSASFTRSENLQHHKEKHTGEKPLKSDECSTSFIRSENLQHHKGKHTREKPFKCVVCSAYFTLAIDLRYHKRKCGEKRFKCDVCRACFSLAHTLKLHKRIHTGEKPYRCDECGACFRLAYHLKLHKRKHTGERPYKCDDCGASFTEVTGLKYHIKKHTGEKPYMCDECGGCFAQTASLIQHKRTHTGEKPYMCDECGARFNETHSLKRHMRTHTGEKPYKCDKCSASFLVPGNLKLHKRTHTGEKPYKCHDCNASFRIAQGLKKHKRIHTGEKPYKCHKCVAYFNQYSSLTRHMRTHTGEKPYKCYKCVAYFTQASSLKRHLRIHTGEKPEKSNCGTFCTEANNLKQHAQTPTGEKPYKCDDCGAFFTAAKGLKHHMRIHTGEKPFI